MGNYMVEENGVRVSIRPRLERRALQDIRPGELMLLSRSTVPPTSAVEFGIRAEAPVTGEGAAHGVVLLGHNSARFEAYEVNDTRIVVFDCDIVPDVAKATFSAPRPGDLMITSTGPCLVVTDLYMGTTGVLDLTTGVATGQHLQREAVVMPWSLVDCFKRTLFTFTREGGAGHNAAK
jgi:hypothetical protein